MEALNFELEPLQSTLVAVVEIMHDVIVMENIDSDINQSDFFYDKEKIAVQLIYELRKRIYAPKAAQIAETFVKRMLALPNSPC